MATLRLRIFGQEDLVGPGTVPDFSDVPVYKLTAFFIMIMMTHSYGFVKSRLWLQSWVPDLYSTFVRKSRGEGGSIEGLI